MKRYYELIKKSKPKNKAKKLRFDPAQQVYFASCYNYEVIEILGFATGLLLDLSDGNRSLADIVKDLSLACHEPEEAIEEVIVNEVRNLQRKHLLYLEA